MKAPIVALVGNPNSGKTTLFNALTGSNQTVGNWPGVTVEKKDGLHQSNGREMRLVDLPGMYTFVAHSADEAVARDFLVGRESDLVINVIDATNLERNLYLTLQLAELRLPMVVALNMWDLALERKINLDIEGLSKELGCPVVPVSSLRPSDVATLARTCWQALENPQPAIITHPLPVPVQGLLDEISKVKTTLPHATWLTLKALEGDAEAFNDLQTNGLLTKHRIDELEQKLGELPQVLIAEARYQAIADLQKRLGGTLNRADRLSESLDKILLHRWLGLPIFFAAMYLVFWTTINLGSVFIDFFDLSVGALLVVGSRQIMEAMGLPEMVIVVLSDGVGAGVQTLSTFVPLIFILFFMLSLLEDSGYMARAAFVMDRFMRILGLPGKAFVPLLVGFGCSVPAIMATRTLENRRDRILTIFMTPFMSCGAKMPVYALFAVAFFANAGQNAVFILYLAGIFMALLTGLLLKRSFLKGNSSQFIMELPAYHVPHLRQVLLHSWQRLRDFIVKAGRILIIVMTFLGALNAIDSSGSPGVEEGEISLLAVMGLTVAPLFEPMGIDEENWPASVSLFMGVFAKEVVVGTISALYAQDAGAGGDQESESPPSIFGQIGEAFTSVPAGMKNLAGSLLDPLGIGELSQEPSGEQDGILGAMRERFGGGPLQAFAYLLFILLYAPCVSAVATAMREMGGALTVFMVLYTTVLAWVVATLFYQITVGHQVVWIGLASAILVLLILSLRFGESRLTRWFGLQNS